MAWWKIRKTFTFEAAHRLPHVSAGHKCGRLHGHSYRFTVELKATELLDGDDEGMVFEYGKLAVALAPTLEALDHRFLNDIPGLKNPTTEVLAAWIWRRIKRTTPFLHAVIVHESCTTRCEYRG